MHPVDTVDRFELEQICSLSRPQLIRTHAQESTTSGKVTNIRGAGSGRVRVVRAKGARLRALWPRQLVVGRG